MFGIKAKEFFQHRTLWLLLSWLAVIKLFFAATIPFRIDMDAWLAWGSMLYRGGFANFYTPDAWTAYFPGYLYFLWLTEAFWQFFGAMGLNTGWSHDFFYKIVPITFDLLGVVLIYAIVFEKTKNTNLSISASALYGLSPFTTFNASIWAQADSVLTFFLILSLYFLTRNQGVQSGVWYGFSLLIKPFAFFLSPTFLLYAIAKKQLKTFSLAIFFTLLTFGLLSVPFFGLNVVGGITSVLDQNADEYGYNSLNTFNFWGVFGFWIDDRTVFGLGQSMQNWGYALTVVIGLLALGLLSWQRLFYVRHKLIDEYVYLSAALFYTIPVMFLTQMHERYWYSAFAFMVIALFLLWSKLNNFLRWTWLGVYVGLALLHSVNLYYVYNFYLFFNMQMPAGLDFYNLIARDLQFFSGLMSLLWLGLFSIILLVPYNYKKYEA